MDKVIIAISGKQRAGKDTVGRLLQFYLNKRLPLRHIFDSAGLADALKNEYCDMHDLSREDLDWMKNNYAEVRAELIELGSYRRDEKQSYWVDRLLEDHGGNLIVTDCRYRDEVINLTSPTTMSFTVRIDAEEGTRSQRGTLSNTEHPSECDLDNYGDWDYVINNDCSLAELDYQVTVIADSILDFMGVEALRKVS